VADFDWKKMDMNSACTWSNVVKANPFSWDSHGKKKGRQNRIHKYREPYTVQNNDVPMADWSKRGHEQ
jgi:hypothetical protein